MLRFSPIVLARRMLFTPWREANKLPPIIKADVDEQRCVRPATEERRCLESLVEDLERETIIKSYSSTPNIYYHAVVKIIFLV